MDEIRPGRRLRIRLLTRRAVRRLAILFAVIILTLVVAHSIMLRMPGQSHRGPLPPLTPAQRDLASELRADVEALAGGIRYRSIYHPRTLAAAAAHIHDQLTAAGFSTIAEYPVERLPTPNLEVTIPGADPALAAQIIVIGAHYDTCQTTPGADDNASGIAATLALARRFQSRPQSRTLRFVLFVGEEPPTFQTPDMGSWVYAKACRGRDDEVVAMLSLETIGYYSTEPDSQHYPPPLGLLYPSTGDFIGFVSNVPNRALVRRCIAAFRETTPFPSEGGALPSGIPGVGWSDHWSFWQEGYPAIMITDTAPFRNPHYHQPTDTPDTLDYERMARVVEGIERVIIRLAN